MLPNFICIGAFRAGTTWLYSVLSRHPQVFTPPEKELLFFSRYYDRGINWYKKFFEDGTDKKIRAEICPAYLSCPEAPQRISKHIPGVKLMACLRNPADQVYSHYNLGLVRGRFTKPFSSLVKDNSFVALQHALYAKHVNNYLRHFDKSQLLVLLYDDLLRDPKGLLKRIYRYLGIDDYCPDFLNKRVNYSREPVLAPLDKFMADIGWILRNRDLMRFKMALNRLGVCNKLKQLNSRRAAIRPMDSKVRQHLNRVFAEDKKALGLMLDTDLSAWQ